MNIAVFIPSGYPHSFWASGAQVERGAQEELQYTRQRLQFLSYFHSRNPIPQGIVGNYYFYNSNKNPIYKF